MKAKELHRIKLLKYLENPDNEWLDRVKLAKTVLGISKQALYNHFTSEELDAIEQEAFAIRRKRYLPDILKIDKAVLDKAKLATNPRMVEIAYDRFVGPLQKQIKVNGKLNGKPLAVVINVNRPPEPESLALWEKMIRDGSRPKTEDKG